MSINRVCISGNLTRDPEMRVTQGGTSIMSIGVAVNDRRFNQQANQWEDYANFVDCVMFGARADSVSRYLAKGDKVSIEGKLRYSSWQATDGNRRSKIEVVIDEIEFLSRNRQQPAAAPQQGYQPPAQQSGGYQQQPRQQYRQQPAAAPQQGYQPPAQQSGGYQQQPRQQYRQQPAAAPQQGYQPPQAHAQAPAPAQAPVQPQLTPAAPSAPAPQAQAYDVYDEDIPF